MHVCLFSLREDTCQCAYVWVCVLKSVITYSHSRCNNYNYYVLFLECDMFQEFCRSIILCSSNVEITNILTVLARLYAPLE